EDVQVAPLRDQLLVLLALVVRDDQAALALGLLAEADGARELGEDRRILRPPRLEQVRDARQTAGDVARLRRLLRQPRDHVADDDPRAALHADHGTRGQRVRRWDIRVREADGLAVLVDELRRRPVLRAARRGVEHDRARQAGDLVDLLRDRDVVDEVLELEVTAHLGHDRVHVRIPARHELTRLHGVAVGDAEGRAVRHLVALALPAELVDDRELARAGRRDQMPLRLVADGLDVLEADRARALHLDAVDRRRSRRRAADVERAHRELRARLADGLRRDDADRLALVHAVTAREIAPVALRAHAVMGLARDRRA